MKSTLQLNIDPRMEGVFASYPKQAANKLRYLRKLIIEEAEKIESIHELEETLKWGEPSYLVKKGSTIRMDWKEKKPDQYAVYFKCTSKIVPSIQSKYSHLFQIEGTRALVFSLDEIIPEKELRHCFRLALTYHQIKQLPNLGIDMI